MKVCTKCGIEKPMTAEYFHRQASHPTGFNAHCKVCRSEHSKRFESENPEKVAAWREKAYLKLRESGALSEYQKAYRQSVPKEVLYARQQRAREKNLEHYRRKAREHAARKRKERPDWILRSLIRSRIHSALSRKKLNSKSSGTIEYLGCSYETLVAHFESKFQPGMTWENRGEWHIDHIVPLATAKTEDEVIRLNHYTNLQPLWAADNLAKGARLDWVPQPTGEKK